MTAGRRVESVSFGHICSSADVLHAESRPQAAKARLHAAPILLQTQVRTRRSPIASYSPLENLQAWGAEEKVISTTVQAAELARPVTVGSSAHLDHWGGQAGVISVNLQPDARPSSTTGSSLAAAGEESLEAEAGVVSVHLSSQLQ